MAEVRRPALTTPRALIAVITKTGARPPVAVPRQRVGAVVVPRGVRGRHVWTHLCNNAGDNRAQVKTTTL